MSESPRVGGRDAVTAAAALIARYGEQLTVEVQPEAVASLTLLRQGLKLTHCEGEGADVHAEQTIGLLGLFEAGALDLLPQGPSPDEYLAVFADGPAGNIRDAFAEVFLGDGETVAAPFRVRDSDTGALLFAVGRDEFGQPQARLHGNGGQVAVSFGTDGSAAAYLDVHDRKGRPIATLCEGDGGMLGLYANPNERQEDTGAELYLTVRERAEIQLRTPDRDNPHDLTLTIGDSGEFIAKSHRSPFWRDPNGASLYQHVERQRAAVTARKSGADRQQEGA